MSAPNKEMDNEAKVIRRPKNRRHKRRSGKSQYSTEEEINFWTNLHPEPILTVESPTQTTEDLDIQDRINSTFQELEKSLFGPSESIKEASVPLYVPPYKRNPKAPLFGIPLLGKYQFYTWSFPNLFIYRF